MHALNSFDLPDIDGKETKLKVEATFNTFRLYMLQTSLDMLPSVTAKYTIVPASGGLPHSPTEEIAIRNIDYERKRKSEMEVMMNAVNRLSMRERAIIISRYLGQEEKYDYEVYTDLNMSHRHYYKVKQNAFYKLALALRIVVYRVVEES